MKQAQSGILSSVRSFAGSIGGILAGIGVGLGLNRLLSISRESVALAEIQIQAEQKLAAVVRATGMSAGFTAEQLKAQASALQAVTTVGDEEILGLQSLMLTFKAVQGDVFERAIALSLDLATVMGGDAKGAALQLAKALEDPVRGLNAMRRSGVSFTEQQQEQIKNLVKTGRLLEAQEIILKAVAGQVEGVAEALAKTEPGRLQQARNLLGDIKEDIGRQLIPITRAFTEVQIQMFRAFEKSLPFMRAGFVLIRDLTRSVASFFSDAFAIAFNFVKDALVPFVGNFESAFTSVVAFLDIMLGSWEGLRSSIINITNQTVLAFQAGWEFTVNWFSQKIIQMVSFFKSAWLTATKETVKIVTPIMTRMFISIENQRRKLQGRSLIGTEETEEGIRSTIATTLASLNARRVESENRTNDKLKQLRIKHEQKLAAIGQKSLEQTRKFEESVGGLPALSGLFKDALAAARATFEAIVPPKITAPGLAQAGESGRGFGRIAVGQLGNKIQDALLKRDDPQKKIAENTTKLVEQNKENKVVFDKIAAKPVPGLV